MKQEVKEDWVINNKNLFGLPKSVDMAISVIQYEISNQIKGNKIQSISEYLTFEANLITKIRLTDNLNIETILQEHLEINFNPMELKKMNVSMILSFLQLSLLKEYYGENCNNILTFSKYQLQYENLLSEYLDSNIDTDEDDFIESELKLCQDLIAELEKSIYSTLNPVGDVIDKPCDFKKNLINSIDKRQKYLEEKSTSKESGLISKNFNADDFSFGADLLVKPKEEFITFLVERYGEKYSKDELDLIVKNYYGGKKNNVRLDAPKKVKINSYIKSVYVYSVFKNCMSDKESSIYYNKLIHSWNESCKLNIEINDLGTIDQNLSSVFSSYLTKILEIYRHAYEYRENDSLKSLNIIDLKEAKFIMLMNEQTDHFVHHLKQQKIIGNYSDLIKRKDYVLGLFYSLETFLVNASINFSKCPFVGLFKESKEKIKNCISFEEIKFLATSTENKPTTEEQKNLKIAIDLIGENNSRTKSIMYHHIPNVLEKHSLNNIEAKNILFTASGGFHPNIQTKIIPKIIDYLKELDFIPKSLTETGPKQQTDFKLKIEKHFAFFQKNCPRKHKQILNENDFDRLIKWTKYYFENDFEVPKISNPIEVVNTNKGYVRLAFRYLFKILHKEKTYPDSLFEFYQLAFLPFEHDKRKLFQAEKNNDEVKKLMEIDY